MRHLSLRYIAIVITLLFSFFCCTKEDGFKRSALEEHEIQMFFNVGNTYSRSGVFQTEFVDFVIKTLQKQDDLLAAVRNYKSRYGIPLWDYSVGITVEEGFQLFVPVYNESQPDEILSIWHFIISSDKLYQYTLMRTTENILLEEYWKYDYFTIYALNKRPKSGIIFRSSVSSRVNAIFYECQTAYIGAEYEGVYVEWPVETLCWEVEGGSLPLPNDGNEDTFPPEIPIEEGSGDNLGGSGGSGASSGGSYTGSGSAPMAQAVFRNSNMTEQNWKVIEDMLEKIIKNCMGEHLYNSLKEKLNGNTLTIEFTFDKASSFYFNGESSGIKLSIEKMESNHLFHEMFHAYQAYQETQSSYVNSLLNMEIEAHYAQYLYLKKLPEFAGSNWSKQYAMDNRHEKIAMLENFLLPNGLLVLDVTEKDLNIQIDSVVTAFRRYPAYSEDSCKYNVDRNGLSIFETLKYLTINCDI